VGISNFEQLNARLAQGNGIVNFAEGSSCVGRSFHIDQDSTRFIRVDSNISVVVPNSRILWIGVRNHFTGALRGVGIGALCGAGLQLGISGVTTWLKKEHSEGNLNLGVAMGVCAAVGAILGGFDGTTDTYVYPHQEVSSDLGHTMARPNKRL
jgi:hypothetical protein